MNTNLNMTETRNSANIGGTNFGGIINSMALAHLLGSKNEAEIAQFEQATGWSWLEACTTALEADPSLTVSASESFEARFERETGMTYGDAVDMAADYQRERRIFGNRSGKRSSNNRLRSVSPGTFESETGWSLGDAMDMAAECRREHRFFGSSARGSHYLN